jgi:hypothetical protein
MLAYSLFVRLSGSCVDYHSFAEPLPFTRPPDTIVISVAWSFERTNGDNWKLDRHCFRGDDLRNFLSVQSSAAQPLWKHELLEATLGGMCAGGVGNQHVAGIRRACGSESTRLHVSSRIRRRSSSLLIPSLKGQQVHEPALGVSVGLRRSGDRYDAYTWYASTPQSIHLHNHSGDRGCRS